MTSWSYRKDHSDVILDAFWRPCGRLFEAFWGHVELRNLLGSSLRVLFRLESEFLTISPPELRPFWKVLVSFWGGFWNDFGIFCGHRFHHVLLYDFEMIFDGFWYLLDKQNQAKSMEGIAKINFSCCSLSNVFENRFWTGFGCRLEVILGANWPSEATSKASFIQYANEEESRWGRSQLTTPSPS